MNTFADMLKYLRKREGLSQRELAYKLKLSPSSIGMYESGKRFPERETEEALADFFNISLNNLRGKDDESPVDYIIRMKDEDGTETVIETTDDVMKLLRDFSRLTEDQQTTVLALIHSMTPSKGDK